jgi:hypothetical protein
MVHGCSAKFHNLKVERFCASASVRFPDRGIPAVHSQVGDLRGRLDAVGLPGIHEEQVEFAASVHAHARHESQARE